MSELDELQKKTFTPSNMTQLEWVLWNNRNNITEFAMEKSLTDLARLHKQVEAGKELYILLKNLIQIYPEKYRAPYRAALAEWEEVSG